MCIETFSNLLGFESSVNLLHWILQLPNIEPRRQKLINLLRFQSSSSKNTSLKEYVTRMKPSQSHIFWLAGDTDEVENSPFVKELIGRGLEVLYMFEAVDEYTISTLPDFNGKMFQNIAEPNLSHDAMTKQFEPFNKWLIDVGLKRHIAKSVISNRLENSSYPLVVNSFEHSGEF